MIKVGLKVKILGLVIGLVAAMGGVAVYVIQGALQRELLSELQKRGVIISEDIAIRGTTFLLTKNITALQGVVLDAVDEHQDVEYAFFHDRKGRIVAHSFPDLFPAALQEMTHHHVHKKPKVTMMETNRGPFYDIGVPVLRGDAGMVHIGVNAESAQEHLENVLGRLLLALLAILAVGLLAGTLFVRYLTRPIMALTLASEKLARGEISHAVPVPSDDEIGRLAQSFNRMQISLVQAHDQLKEINVTLERRIDDRTRALAIANKQLLGEIDARVKAADELKRYQAGLENMVKLRTADLSRANRDLRDFAYIVSHDLRSPLVSIQGFMEELQMDLDELAETLAGELDRMNGETRETINLLLHTRISEDLEYIRSSAYKMDGLIKAILKLSRLGHRDFQFEKLDLKRMAEENVKALAHTIKETGAQVTVGDLPTLTSDATAMEQILGNLLSNALKYLDPARSGVIEVMSDADRANGTVTLHFRDNGRGIAAKDIPKIFKLFQRVGRQDQPGDGMGLSYVTTLVKRLGGDIDCRSALGEGTTFTVTLPATPPREHDV